MGGRAERTLATVILRHTLGDGTWHYDWMVERPDGAGAGGGGDTRGVLMDTPPRGVDGEERALATWRMAESAAGWRAGDRVAMERIGDHRRAYLAYEGPLSGGRGRVDRVDAGQATATGWSAGYALLEVRLGGFEGRVELRREEAENTEAGPGPSRGAQVRLGGSVGHVDNGTDGGGGERWVAIVLERRGGDDMMH